VAFFLVADPFLDLHGKRGKEATIAWFACLAAFPGLRASTGWPWVPGRRAVSSRPPVQQGIPNPGDLERLDRAAAEDKDDS